MASSQWRKRQRLGVALWISLGLFVFVCDYAISLITHNQLYIHTYIHTYFHTYSILSGVSFVV